MPRRDRKASPTVEADKIEGRKTTAENNGIPVKII
jgi:hypothetical protein